VNNEWVRICKEMCCSTKHKDDLRKNGRRIGEKGKSWEKSGRFLICGGQRRLPGLAHSFF
jgi:hypothetical protein